MNNILPFPTSTTNCLRCGEVCQRGTPDKSKAGIWEAKEGFCASCMIEKFLLSVEPIRAMFEGTGQKGPMHGPEIFLNKTWRNEVLAPVLTAVLLHTQMPADSINWINVVSNWGMPFPKTKRRSPDLFE